MWTRDKQIDERTRKLMTMHKALHPRDDVDRLYVARKEGGRGLASIEDSVDTSIQRLEGYIQKHDPIYPTPPLGQDMTQGQFLKRSFAGLNSEFSFS